MLFNFFESMEEAVEYLIALGSLMGVLGLIIGIIGFISLGQFRRHQMIGVIVVSIILLVVCGTHTGFKYFNIYH